MTAVPLTAKAHLELCLKEQKHYINARSHCRLAKLYEDYDQQKCDVVELEFQVKWEKVKEATEVLERILKGHPSEEAWNLIQKMLLSALAKRSTERAVFAGLSPELFDNVISGLTKNFGTNDVFMSQLHLFILEMSSESRYAKLANQALIFLTSKASGEADSHDGVSQFHVLIAVFVAPLLLDRKLSVFRMEQVSSVLVCTVHVAVSWPAHKAKWSDELKNFLPSFQSDSKKFTQHSWDIVRDLLCKYIVAYNFGTAASLSSNASTCDGFSKSIQLLNTLKTDAKNLLRFVVVWRGFAVWKEHVSSEELLIWLPENRWNGDVDKIIDDAPEGSSERPSPPAKRSRNSRERRTTLTTPQAEIPLIPPCDELAEAYGLCSAAVCELISTNEFVKTADSYLKLINHYPLVHKFISESLIFKMKFNDAIIHLNERVLNKPEESDDIVLNAHLICANELERNWTDTFNLLVVLLSHTSNWEELEKEFERCDRFDLEAPQQARFCIIKASGVNELVFDYLHHLFYKVYTSTTLDHDNDELFGSLLILSQINFYTQGFRSFNRISRHIEAKGSLNYPGLAKYITNVTILEELARIQEFCSEYVSIQIAAPQVQRRIGQSTRHSVRGTRVGQKQSLEEQIRKGSESPVLAVVSYFVDNQENILKILRNR